MTAPNDVESASTCVVPALNSQEQVNQTPNRMRCLLVALLSVAVTSQSTHKERLLRSALAGPGTDKLLSAPPQSIHLTTLSNVQAQLPPLHRALFNHGANHCDCDCILQQHSPPSLCHVTRLSQRTLRFERLTTRRRFTSGFCVPARVASLFFVTQLFCWQPLAGFFAQCNALDL